MDKPNENLEERISILEKSKNQKSIWEIISIVSSLLIPVSVFFAGYFLSQVDKQVKIQGLEKEIQLAEIKSKIDQAQVVASFLEALVDSNAYKRQLAIKSILLALPDKGSAIVEEISKNDPNKKIKNYAKQSLSDKIATDRTALIQQMYSSVKYSRISATEALIQHWNKDPLLISAVVGLANQKLDSGLGNENGIVNSIVLLSSMDIALLKENKAMVNALIQRIETLKDRKQTQQILGKLKKRF